MAEASGRPAKGGDEEGVFAVGVRGEEAHYLIVVESQARGPEAEAIGAEIGPPADQPRLGPSAARREQFQA